MLDVDYVALLREAGAHLAPNGCIVVKDNCAPDKSAFVYDCTDASVARGRAYHEACFRLAGLRVVEEDAQRQWDRELMTVRLWMLQPASWAGAAAGAGAGAGAGAAAVDAASAAGAAGAAGSGDAGGAGAVTAR